MYALHRRSQSTNHAYHIDRHQLQVLNSNYPQGTNRIPHVLTHLPPLPPPNHSLQTRPAMGERPMGPLHLLQLPHHIILQLVPAPHSLSVPLHPHALGLRGVQYTTL